MTPHAADVISVLAEVSIRIAPIAVVAGLALVALRIRAGAVCHAAWTAVVITMLLLPVMPKWLPSIPVWIPQPPAVTLRADAPAEPASARTAPASAPLVAVTSEPRPAAIAQASRNLGPAAPVRAFPWSLTLVAIWATVALAMLGRLALGWRYAARLAAGSRPSSLNASFFESDLVATPVTVGVLFPRVILPPDWTTWPADMRDIVLAHEREHIRRRDTLINIVAGLNRSVFWFHPLAWWLERRLASAAEQACDDVVVRKSGQADRYASLLVAMADAVRQSGGRVAWQGVGMAGGASLGSRIDRVLGGVASRVTSRTRKVILSATCAVAIVLAVACQQTVPPLRPDPEVAARLAARKASGEKYEAARTMTMDQVAAAEATVAKNPEDLEATEKLLVFYQQSGQRSMGWNEMVAARRPHLVRMIEHHPESDLATWPFRQSLDPVGYAQARALWMKHVGKPDVTAKILGAAANFFDSSEKTVAEQLLLRAKAMDPDGPQPRVANNIYYPQWSARLGDLYGSAIIDADAQTLGGSPSSPRPADPNESFAAAARGSEEAGGVYGSAALTVGRFVALAKRQVERRALHDRSAKQGGIRSTGSR